MRNTAIRTLLLCSLALPATASLAADLELDAPGSIEGLLKGSDSVVAGQALGASEVPGGLLHDFKVTQTIWAEPGCVMIKIFTLRADLPDTPTLNDGEECAVGIRWIDPSSPEWARRLGTESAAHLTGDLPRSIGVLTSDAKLSMSGNTELFHQVSAWVRTVRGSACQADLETAACSLLDHDAAFLRRSALQALVDATEPLAASTVESVRRAFERELHQQGNVPCLRGSLNLMALRQIDSGNEKAIVWARRSISTLAPGLSSETLSDPNRGSSLAQIAYEKLKHPPTPKRERETAR